MTNAELYEQFKAINSITNCFDKAITLKKFNKQYKHSDFFKATHYSLEKAYFIYKITSIDNLLSFLSSEELTELSHGKTTKLAILFEDFIESFDFTKLDGFFNYLGSKFDSQEWSQMLVELKSITGDFITNINKK